MTTKAQINKLWEQFRTAIDAAYAEANKVNDNDGVCLRDYAQNISWHDDLAALLGRETANERQHRRNGPAVNGFSVDSAAKLLLMHNAADGATSDEMPSATKLLVCRKTAIEAEVIGFLARKQLSQTWRDAVGSLDYAKLMR